MSKIKSALNLLAASVISVALITWIYQLIWNWVMVDLFSLPTVTFIQMFCLRILLSIFRDKSSITGQIHKIIEYRKNTGENLISL